MADSTAIEVRPGLHAVRNVGLGFWLLGLVLAIGAVALGSESYEGLESKLSLTGVTMLVVAPLLATGGKALIVGPRGSALILIYASLIAATVFIVEIWRNTGSDTTVIVALIAAGVAGIMGVIVMLTRPRTSERAETTLAALTWLSVAVTLLLSLAALAFSGNG